MVNTRSAATNSNSGKDETAAGTKRKADASSPKRERKAAKKQTTIEEAMSHDNEHSECNDADMIEEPSRKSEEESAKDDEPSATVSKVGDRNGESSTPSKLAEEEETVQESSQRGKQLPSSILEKGIIYFFTRNRVGIDDADSVGDLQRSFFVLRPLPANAKLGDGPLPESENNRLFALPKKVFPRSHRDRFMTFVEKAPASIRELKDDFMKGSSYETKTAGTRHIEPVTTVAEGVYAITRTEDRTTHLVYAITIPTELGEVQEDLGLRTQGSFIFSVKNPERSGPASANLPKGPEFPKEIIEEFRGLAWAEVKPKYLDYPNAQFLLIGENIDHAAKPTTKDEKHGKDAPKEELDKLEHEDELRVKHLKGNDTVFEDLKISKNDYPKVPTTW